MLFMNKLLLTVLLFFAHAGLLHGMDPTPLYQLRRTVLEKKLSPITLLQTYQYFSHILCSDIAKHIYLFQFNNNLAELDAKKNSRLALDITVQYIEKLIASYEYVATQELCKYFFEQAHISITDNGKGRSCFHFIRNPKVFQTLIEIAGKDASKLLSKQDYSGFTALHWHARENNAEVVELILNTVREEKYKLLTKKTWKSENTALHETSSHETAKLLLLAAGDKAYDLLIMENKYNSTAFDYLIDINNIKLIKFALNALGEKTHDLFFEQDYDTIFTHAVERGNIEIIKLMLDTAGNKAQDLILMPNDGLVTASDYLRYTAFAEATPEIREIMKPYMEPKKFADTLLQLKKLEKDKLERQEKSKQYNLEKSNKKTEKNNCLIS